jgi:glutaminase
MSSKAAVLDVSRLDNINDPARELLASMSTALREAGKAGFLVDPHGAVIRTQHQFEAVAFTSIDDAVKAAEYWIRTNGSG